MSESLFATTALDERNQKVERVYRRLFLAMTLLLILPVFLILTVLVTRGASALSLNFLFTNPEQGMTAGGVFPALLGTIFLVTAAVLRSGRRHQT